MTGYLENQFCLFHNLVRSLITYHSDKGYNVTFTESGLPPGLNWSVVLIDRNGTQTEQRSSGNSIRFSGINGLYTYAIPRVTFGKKAVNISGIPAHGPVDYTSDTIRVQFSHFEPSWAGYIVASNVSDPAPDVTAVRGSWRVPVLPQNPSEMTPVFQWIGIGGFFPGDSANLIQVGTASLTGGIYQPQYDYGWTEVLPSLSEEIPPEFVIVPGDTMWAEIHAETPQNWNITLRDLTQKWQYNRSVHYNSSMDSAEWVLENPSYEGETYGLANFGTADFGNGSLTTEVNTATIDNLTGPVSSFSGCSITMVNNNTSLARPSPVTPDGSFSVYQDSDT